MNKRKTLIIIAIILVLIAVILFLLLLLFKKQPVNVTPSVTPYPTFIFQPSVTQIPLGVKILISDIPVNNFIKSVKKINSNGDMLIEDNGSYHIVYFPNTRQFLLSIQQSPFEKYRIEAEAALLNLLGINKTQACKLDTVITTPFFANPEEAGQSYKLSFCE